MYGEYRDWYRINVVDGPESDEERLLIISFVNMMCGNVEKECAYAMYHFSLGDRLASVDECRNDCRYENSWDSGFHEYELPCQEELDFGEFMRDEVSEHFDLFSISSNHTNYNSYKL